MKQVADKCVFSEIKHHAFAACGVRPHKFYVSYSALRGDHIERFKNHVYDGFYVVLRSDPCPCKGSLMCERCARIYGEISNCTMMECEKDGSLL